MEEWKKIINKENEKRRKENATRNLELQILEAFYGSPGSFLLSWLIPSTGAADEEEKTVRPNQVKLYFREKEMYHSEASEVRNVIREKNGIMWGKFPSGGPLLSKKKKLGLFFILGPQEHFWSSPKNHHFG